MSNMQVDNTLSNHPIEWSRKGFFTTTMNKNLQNQWTDRDYQQLSIWLALLILKQITLPWQAKLEEAIHIFVLSPAK